MRRSGFGGTVLARCLLPRSARSASRTCAPILNGVGIWMRVCREGACHLQRLQHREGKDEMTKASIDLQDLRRRIYVKAKAEPSWRFWGLYVHVCKMETLRAAYEIAKQNDGAPGVDGVTFEAIEARGVETLLEQLRDELTGRTYKPLPARRQEIPKDGG